jgi:hypothetical protein
MPLIGVARCRPSTRCGVPVREVAVGRGARRCCEPTARPPLARSGLTWRARRGRCGRVACCLCRACRLRAGRGALWGGAYCRPGPARLRPSRCRRRAWWRAGGAGQRACGGWSGHGSRPGRSGGRVRCPPPGGNAGWGHPAGPRWSRWRAPTRLSLTGCWDGDSRGQARHVPRECAIRATSVPPLRGHRAGTQRACRHSGRAAASR